MFGLEIINGIESNKSISLEEMFLKNSKSPLTIIHDLERFGITGGYLTYEFEGNRYFIRPYILAQYLSILDTYVDAGMLFFDEEYNAEYLYNEIVSSLFNKNKDKVNIHITRIISNYDEVLDMELYNLGSELDAAILGKYNVDKLNKKYKEKNGV